ncbi:hypothetical protein ISS96_02460 [Candidatus Bathyarchaeota archaeon]|nr:hypothetical protein [Candidatus Bathyarchaeota archaeon]
MNLIKESSKLGTSIVDLVIKAYENVQKERERRAKRNAEELCRLEIFKRNSPNQISMVVADLYHSLVWEAEQREKEDLGMFEFSLSMFKALSEDMNSLRSVVTSSFPKSGELRDGDEELLRRLEELEERSKEWDKLFKFVQKAKENQKQWMKDNV